MTQEDYRHPIAPPTELVQQWRTEPEYASSNQFLTMVSMTQNRLMELCQKSAQYGADQELEECIKWLKVMELVGSGDVDLLLHDRRPNPEPLSLKEQALEELEEIKEDLYSAGIGFNAPAIFRALEQLDD